MVSVHAPAFLVLVDHGVEGLLDERLREVGLREGAVSEVVGNLLAWVS